MSACPFTVSGVETCVHARAEVAAVLTEDAAEEATFVIVDTADGACGRRGTSLVGFGGDYKCSEYTVHQRQGDSGELTVRGMFSRVGAAVLSSA